MSTSLTDKDLQAAYQSGYHDGLGAKHTMMHIHLARLEEQTGGDSKQEVMLAMGGVLAIKSFLKELELLSYKMHAEPPTYHHHGYWTGISRIPNKE